MTAPLSNDLRERVVTAVLSGESCRSVAARFGVAVSSVVKWSQRYRTPGLLHLTSWVGTVSPFWNHIVTSSSSGSIRFHISLFMD